MKKVVVISLGGSQIFKNNKVNLEFLSEFKKIVLKHSKNFKFVIVCGGGSVARMYMSALDKAGKGSKLQSFVGISVTRTNARFMSYFFGEDSEEGIPTAIKQVGNLIEKQNIVFCGALEYKPRQTSDSTAAEIASSLDSNFINITNVDGLFTGNPLVSRNVQFISEISWKNFYEKASKIAFKPGMHFVLDQKAAKIIMDKKIRTYITGNNLGNLDSILSGKKFKGTSIFG